MLDPQALTYVVYFFVVTSVVLLVEGVYLSWSSRRSYKGAVNARLKKLETDANVENVLVGLRKGRGLDEAGNYRYSLGSLNKLFLQSGTTGNAVSFFLTFFLGALLAGATAFLLARSSLLGLCTVLIGAVLPLIILLRRRAKRRARFAAQLPDAIDIIVRSLKAGHPTSVALGLVAREMADPIGTEFGIVADEMTYGLSLESAMRNLSERVGLEDLRLIVVSLSIQASSGGNLTELLANMSQVIRDRFKMRRKIRALSAEGRGSAYFLAALPFFLAVVLSFMVPEVYTKLYQDPTLIRISIGCVVWMTIGAIVMSRMVNFEF